MRRSWQGSGWRTPGCGNGWALRRTGSRVSGVVRHFQAWCCEPSAMCYGSQDEHLNQEKAWQVVSVCFRFVTAAEVRLPQPATGLGKTGGITSGPSRGCPILVACYHVARDEDMQAPSPTLSTRLVLDMEGSRALDAEGPMERRVSVDSVGPSP